MVAVKLIISIFISMSLLSAEISVAAIQKQHRSTTHKRTMLNGNAKGHWEQEPETKIGQRNGRMNYYNSHMWPTTNIYYRPRTTSSIYLRAPSTTASTIHYPIYWGNPYISMSPLRQTDNFSSSSSTPPLQSLNNRILSRSSSYLPAPYDMGAFMANVALMEHPVARTNPSLWSMGETKASTPNTRLNLFNNFYYNDDSDVFDKFPKQFLK